MYNVIRKEQGKTERGKVRKGESEHQFITLLSTRGATCL